MSGMHIDGSNKRIAILISVLAALLALAEMAGKSALRESLDRNIEAANLWAFFQAKTIRATVLRSNGELAEVLADDAGQKERLAKQRDTWRATIDRWESEPDTGEGRKELAARAKAAEEARHRAEARYHQFEIASAALQIAIVMASASVITEVVILAYVAALLGIGGASLVGLAWFAPAAIHF